MKILNIIKRVITVPIDFGITLSNHAGLSFEISADDEKGERVTDLYLNLLYHSGRGGFKNIKNYFLFKVKDGEFFIHIGIPFLIQIGVNSFKYGGYLFDEI